MKKVFYGLLLLSVTVISGCNDEIADLGQKQDVTNEMPAIRANSVVVWQAEPGTINVPYGQTVTVNLDGTVVRN